MFSIYEHFPRLLCVRIAANIVYSPLSIFDLFLLTLSYGSFSPPSEQLPVDPRSSLFQRESLHNRSLLLSSFKRTMENDCSAILRTLSRRFIRLPKHLVLQPRRFVPGYQRWAKREEGSLIRHVRVVPHKQAVFVTFAETSCGEAGVDAYGAVVCVFVLAISVAG